jgi:hypothetical protein
MNASRMSGECLFEQKIVWIAVSLGSEDREKGQERNSHQLSFSHVSLAAGLGQENYSHDDEAKIQCLYIEMS